MKNTPIYSKLKCLNLSLLAGSRSCENIILTLSHMKDYTACFCRSVGALTLLLNLCIIPFFLQSAHAWDQVKVHKNLSLNDTLDSYHLKLLITALQKTNNKYGEFQIESSPPMEPNRALKELIKGEIINVDVAPISTRWEQKTIQVKIPLSKGYLGYYVFFINRTDIAKFAAIKSLEEIKKLEGGFHSHGPTVQMMKALGYNVVIGNSYEGLFKMLASNRFDYLLRRVFEVSNESEYLSTKFPDMVIEPTLALHIPLPVYFFVTPNAPELARRIREGLLDMLSDGSYDVIFEKNHRNTINEIGLEKRKIFYNENPALYERYKD